MQALVAEGVPQLLELASLALEVLGHAVSASAPDADSLCTLARELAQALLSGSSSVAALSAASPDLSTMCRNIACTASCCSDDLLDQCREAVLSSYSLCWRAAHEQHACCARDTKPSWVCLQAKQSLVQLLRLLRAVFRLDAKRQRHALGELYSPWLHVLLAFGQRCTPALSMAWSQALQQVQPLLCAGDKAVMSHLRPADRATACVWHARLGFKKRIKAAVQVASILPCCKHGSCMTPHSQEAA